MLFPLSRWKLKTRCSLLGSGSLRFDLIRSVSGAEFQTQLHRAPHGTYSATFSEPEGNSDRVCGFKPPPPSRFQVADSDCFIVCGDDDGTVHVAQVIAPLPRKVDVRLPGKENSNSHGARPVHQIISMIKWIRTSRKSIKTSFPLAPLRVPYRCRAKREHLKRF